MGADVPPHLVALVDDDEVPLEAVRAQGHVHAVLKVVVPHLAHVVREVGGWVGGWLVGLCHFMTLGPCAP